MNLNLVSNISYQKDRNKKQIEREDEDFNLSLIIIDRSEESDERWNIVFFEQTAILFASKQLWINKL